MEYFVVQLISQLDWGVSVDCIKQVIELGLKNSIRIFLNDEFRNQVQIIVAFQLSVFDHTIKCSPNQCLAQNVLDFV